MNDTDNAHHPQPGPRISDPHVRAAVSGFLATSNDSAAIQILGPTPAGTVLTNLLTGTRTQHDARPRPAQQDTDQQDRDQQDGDSEIAGTHQREHETDDTGDDTGDSDGGHDGGTPSGDDMDTGAARLIRDNQAWRPRSLDRDAAALRLRVWDHDDHEITVVITEDARLSSNPTYQLGDALDQLHQDYPDTTTVHVVQDTIFTGPSPTATDQHNTAPATATSSDDPLDSYYDQMDAIHHDQLGNQVDHDQSGEQLDDQGADPPAGDGSYHAMNRVSWHHFSDTHTFITDWHKTSSRELASVLGVDHSQFGHDAGHDTGCHTEAAPRTRLADAADVELVDEDLDGAW